MKVMHVLAVTLIFVLLGTCANAEDRADEILGEWYTDDGESKVLIEKRHGKYFGTIIWLRETIYGPEHPEAGAIMHDRHNPDARLRARPLIGIAVLRDFVFNAKKNHWEDGTIYDPKKGKEYKSKIRLMSNRKGEEEPFAKIRGFIGFSAFGRTVICRRVPKDENEAERN